MTGVSYRSAPLATREALSLTRDQMPEALDTLKNHVGHGVTDQGVFGLQRTRQARVRLVGTLAGAHPCRHSCLELDPVRADLDRLGLEELL